MALSSKGVVVLVDFESQHLHTERQWLGAEAALGKLAEREGEMRRLSEEAAKIDPAQQASRLDELQAVILRIKLKRLDSFNNRRIAIADSYNRQLAGLVETPVADGHGRHVYHQYTILSDHREAIQKALTDAGIACAVYYPVPLHRQEMFAATHGQVSLPVTESVAQRCLSLPISPMLRDEQIDRIAGVIRQELG